MEDQLKEEETKPKDEEARKAFYRIWDEASENIKENERVVDNQTVIVSIGILANLIVILSKTTSDFSSFLLLILIILSMSSLALCVITPTVFISNRRKLKDDMRNIKGVYSKEDLGEMEQKRIGTANIKGLLKISPLEEFRFWCIIFTILLSLVFYSMMIYNL